MVHGKVVNLAKFGAFVELAPGIEGLIHNTEISWTERVKSPKYFFKKDQEVEVKVVEIDQEERRIRLSTKRLEGSPWEKLAEKYQPGQVVKLPVARIAQFGLFV